MLNRNQTAPCLLQEIFAIDLNPPDRSCKHVYLTNLDRSRIPGPDQSPNDTTVWSVAAICQKCRAHLDLVVDLGGCTTPCPADDNPYHHFTCVVSEGDELEEATLGNRFVCSSERCQAKAMVVAQNPVLLWDDIMYLMDSSILGARLQAAKVYNPDFKDKSAADVLNLFLSCINDALRNDENRDIPTDNKMFRACLGDGIADLLLRLGFSKIEPTATTPRSYWRLPKPPKHPFDPLWDPIRKKLEDVRDELTLLILNRPEIERKLLKTTPQALTSAQGDFERVLGIRSVDARDLNLLNAFSGEQTAIAPYRRLGIVPHFSEPSVLWAFNRQSDVAPTQRQYYLQCLKEIAAARRSESLQTEAAIAESLQSDANMSGNLQFGNTDHSPAFGNYQDALTFLGAHPNTTDEFVWTLMTAKAAEFPDLQRKAHNAVHFIAEERQSEILRNQLAGSDGPKFQMDLKKAHTTLGVSEDIETEHLIAQFETNIMESPGRESEFREALCLIAEKRENNQLNGFVRSRFYSANGESSLDEPRSIKNIGNTCYLNSLLQYLYTIKPLRELVGCLDEYQEDFDPSHLKSKRVGNSQVNIAQVRRALKFAQELDKLFRSLTTARTTFVTPSVDLARLTLINVVDDEVRRRQSTTTGPAPPNISVTTTTLDTLPDAIDIGEPIDRAESPQELNPISDQSSGTTAVDPINVHLDANPDGDTILPDVDDAEQPKTNGHMPQSQSRQDDTLNGNPPPIPPRPQHFDHPTSTNITQEVENWAKQQDVREVMQNVLSQLRWFIKGEGVEKDGEQIDTISHLFSGKERYTTVTGSDVQEIIEPFFEIVLYLTGPCDIYAALDDTFDQADIEDSADISQYRTIAEIPPVLQISVSRVGYNKITGTPFKVEDPLQLQDLIHMDRYMSDDHILEKRRQAWTWKSELKMLRAKRDALTVPELEMDVAGALRTTNEYLKSLADSADELELDRTLIDKPLLLGIERLADFAAEQITQLDSKLVELEEKRKTVFEGDKRYPYRLHAVFIHRGDSNAKGGHWFIYIHDSEHQVWRCYNDETITTVTNTRPIFQPAKDWMEGTSSFIVYIREDMMQDIVNTVYRDPEAELELQYSPPRSPPPKTTTSRSPPPLSDGKTWSSESIPGESTWDIDRSGDTNISW